jgi:ABC-type uncharacterized transport system permease subunit
LIAGYGYTGILVAFIARQNPLAILPVAVLLGGISASGGMLQRRLDMPDATVLVLQGMAFMLVLAAETLYGRFRIFQAKPVEEKYDGEVTVGTVVAMEKDAMHNLALTTVASSRQSR